MTDSYSSLQHRGAACCFFLLGCW